jgi:hypothetical protein
MARTVAQSGVAYLRPELAGMLPLYQTVRDCVEGSEAIKRGRELYLPRPNIEDTSKEALLRYRTYLARAVFYNFTRRTMYGLIGQVFNRAPQVELPAELDYMPDDVTGSGVTLEQLAKKATGFTLGFGRCGLLADYPDTDGAVTLADVQMLKVRPSVTVYAPDVIRNWRTVTIGAKTMLSLVVLSEQFQKSDDGFEVKHGRQFRVLRLVDLQTAMLIAAQAAGGQGAELQDVAIPAAMFADLNTVTVYVVELWREQETGSFIIHKTYIPKDSTGKPFDHIPFTFIGSENNDSNPDYPPMFDLADLNTGHYRNSADYEESVFVLGQPTLSISGLTEEWYKNVLKEKVLMGSRGGLPLNVGAKAELLQVAPNTMAREAMQDKERQAVALGAKLVESKDVARTAFEADLEKQSENSVLATIAQNVSDAIEWALKECCLYVGVDGSKIEFDLNTEFDLQKLTPEERRQTIQEWQAGALAWEEMRGSLRRAGIASLPDDEAKQLIADELAALGEIDPTKFDGGKPGNMTTGKGG